jgi:hypothetical protein
MSQLPLTDREIQQGVIDDRRSKLRTKLDLESAQGFLPFTNERLFEQSNPILRSALFIAGKMNVKEQQRYNDWTPIFSLGSGSIQYRGPLLTVDHETVLARIMVLARGRSLTKPVHCFQTDVLKWLNLDQNSGANYKKARRIIDDLGSAELRIGSKQALQRLLLLLQSPAISEMPDGAFFQEYVKNRFGDQIKMIADGIANDEPVNITMKFITGQAHNSISKRMMLSLDPIAAIFFDGVNTTLIPFEIIDQQDRFGRKLLPFIASHRDGVKPIMLEKYHFFSGSKSEYSKVKRRVKSELKKRFQNWESEGLIAGGWDIYRNKEGEEVVNGLKIGEKVRTKSILELPPHVDTEKDVFDDAAVQGRFEEFSEHFNTPPDHRKK